MFSKKKSFGFVIDPLENFDRAAETTLFLMRELFSRGHSIFTFESQDIFLKQNEVKAHSKKICMISDPQHFYEIEKEEDISLSKMDLLFLRKDPPFNLNYGDHLRLLAKLEGKLPMVNSPTSVLRFDEKLTALDFPYSPKTLVTAKIDRIIDWAKQFAQGLIIKPLGDGGGRGIIRFQSGDSDERTSELKQITESETKVVVCQEYLLEVEEGDKRILLWNGKILGVFLRKPKAGEFRANLHQGASFVACKLTQKQKSIALKIGAWCKKQKLYFVGLDMIGDFVTEINVTSPMGIREINVLYGVKVEEIIIKDICRVV